MKNEKTYIIQFEAFGSKFDNANCVHYLMTLMRKLISQFIGKHEAEAALQGHKKN